MRRPPLFHSLALSGLVSLAAPAAAQSGPQALVLLVDPTSAESMHFANEYAAAHDLPDVLRLYIPPGASDLATQFAVNVEGFLGHLEQAGIAQQVDGVLAMPGSSYFVNAPGFVSDLCAPVNRFTVTAAYTLAHVRDDILDGTVHSSLNQYHKPNYVARAFDAQTPYRFGLPSDAAAAERYYLGGLLGWTGTNGNTQAEVLDMIQRSAAAYGTFPTGTAYYMQTTDIARSGPRHDTYPTAVARMAAAGGLAQHLFADLPLGQQDVMGIMTGRATLDIDGANMTLLPGSFADHLTSFAGAFWTNSQTKMSRWIAKGASGTAGAVEEPCNYPQKFNRAALHVIYRKGLSLGESWFRTLGFQPFQNLFLGDPLTRPYALPPVVQVAGLPAGPTAGTVLLSPSATAPSGAAIERFELYADGRLVTTSTPGTDLLLDTNQLADGPHDLVVIAIDDSLMQHAGRWLGTIDVAVAGLSLGGQLNATSGDLASPFEVSYALTGAAAEEVVLLGGGRVLAQASGPAGVLRTYGQNLGAGPVSVHLEARTNGRAIARSAALSIDVAATPGSPSAPPTASTFVQRVQAGTPFVLNLPAAYDVDPALASFEVLAAPQQASLLTPSTSSWQVLDTTPAAAGSDLLTYSVSTPGGSDIASIVLLYDPAPCTAPTNYCFSVPGTHGLSATLAAQGSTSLAAADFALLVEDARPNVFGFVFQGTGEVQVPLGDGFLCVGADQARYAPITVDGSGSALFPIDYAAPPLPAAQILPGSSWNFQFWYRDASPTGAGSNLTDAVAATFCP